MVGAYDCQYKLVEQYTSAAACNAKIPLLPNRTLSYSAVDTVLDERVWLARRISTLSSCPAAPICLASI